MRSPVFLMFFNQSKSYLKCLPRLHSKTSIDSKYTSSFFVSLHKLNYFSPFKDTPHLDIQSSGSSKLSFSVPILV